MTEEQTAKILRIGGAAATVAPGACVHAASESLPLGRIMAGRAGISPLLILIYGLLTAPVRDLLPRRTRRSPARSAFSAASASRWRR